MNHRRRSSPSKGRGKGSGRTQRRGSGRGQRSSSADEAVNKCVCPNCGEKVPHQRGVPCNRYQCPSCGAKMVSDMRSQDVTQKQTSESLSKGVSSTEIPEVNEDRCTGCGVCAEKCPADAIVIENGKAKIRPELCRNCGLCISVCPNDAIE